MSKLLLRRLQNLDLASLDDDDRGLLAEWCKAALEELGDEEEDKGKEEGKDKSKDKEGKESKNQEDDGWSPPGTNQFVFNLGATEKWPKTAGGSIREREIASRKEQSS